MFDESLIVTSPQPSKDPGFLVKLFRYITDFDASSRDNITYLQMGDFKVVVQPFFEINTDHEKVIAQSQIIDAGEVFERMSVKATRIRLNGTILIDSWEASRFDLGSGVRDIFGEGSGKSIHYYRQQLMLMALDEINRHIYAKNEILPIENPYLNRLGIEFILIKRMTTSPLAGSVGFEYSIDAVDATSNKNNKEETLIISQ
jgi:hypothetical protein